MAKPLPLFFSAGTAKDSPAVPVGESLKKKKGGSCLAS